MDDSTKLVGIDAADQALQRYWRRAGDADGHSILKVIAYIHEHYAEPLTRGALANFAAVSSRHLTRCFAAEVGIPPVVYLNRYRIREAKRLLRGSEKSISEIARAVGFSNHAYFYGAEVATLTAEEGPAYGAALLAGVGAGLFVDVYDAVDRCVVVGNVTRPDPAAQERYAQVYAIYRDLYRKLSESMHQLSRMTHS